MTRKLHFFTTIKKLHIIERKGNFMGNKNAVNPHNKGQTKQIKNTVF